MVRRRQFGVSEAWLSKTIESLNHDALLRRAFQPDVPGLQTAALCGMLQEAALLSAPQGKNAHV